MSGAVEFIRIVTSSGAGNMHWNAENEQILPEICEQEAISIKGTGIKTQKHLVNDEFHVINITTPMDNSTIYTAVLIRVDNDNNTYNIIERIISSLIGDSLLVVITSTGRGKVVLSDIIGNVISKKGENFRLTELIQSNLIGVQALIGFLNWLIKNHQCTEVSMKCRNDSGKNGFLSLECISYRWLTNPRKCR